MERDAFSEIVPLTHPQVEAVAELLFAQLREHDIPSERGHIRARLRAVLQQPELGLVLVALRAQEPLGVAFVSWAMPLEHTGEVAWLEELYVRPEERNVGVGRALLQAVVTRAEERGCVSLELEVTRSHARAAHLYEREGFRDLERRHLVRPLGRWDW